MKSLFKDMLQHMGIVLACLCLCISLSGCSEDISAEESNPSEETEIKMAADVSTPWGEFEGFINGSEAAVVDAEVNLGYDDFDCVNCGKKYTISELNDYMINSEYYTHNPVIYAYFMKRDSGNLLLLKYDGMDIYCKDDDSFVVFAITSQKDGLHITYDVESWCRNEVEINAEGIIASEGSSGAGDHIADKGYLDDQGQYKEIFIVEECGSGWINSMFTYHTGIAFSTETQNHAYEVDMEDDNIVALYSIDGQIYGTVEYGDTKAATALRESAEKDGIIWVDETEIDGLIEKYENELGLTDALNAGEPDWILFTSPSD